MRLSRFLSSAFVLLALILLVSSFSPVAHAATIVVNNLGDVTPPGQCATSGVGSCTLREAILYANAAGGTDTITFGVSGTITLNSRLPGITSNLTINGQGQNIIVDGAGNVRVLTVKATSAKVTLLNFTIAHGKCSGPGNAAGITNNGTLNANNLTLSENDGYSGSCLGGAIQNNGVLTVQNSTFSGNSGLYGAGIYNELDSTLNVSGSQFSGNLYGTGTGIYNAGNATVAMSSFTGNSTSNLANGGAIRNEGTMKIDQSSLSGNSAHQGGGIYTTGTLNLTNSTVSDNTGEAGGGGIYNDGSSSDVATLNVTNSTFTQNSAPAGNGGALYNLDGTLNVTNSTIWANSTIKVIQHSGGIYNDGNSVTLRNTIVANNSGSQCYDYAKSLTADNHNLDDDGTCNQATQKSVAAIALGSLIDNGGPTYTLAPQKGSAAIDAGDDNVCATRVNSPNYGAGSKDQRGVLRPQLYHCDVGAYEFNAEDARGFVVNSTNDTNDGSCDVLGEGTGSQDCTLREAIRAANADNSPDVITFNIPASATNCDAANDCMILIDKPLPDATSRLLIDGAPNAGHITIVPFGKPILTVQNTTVQLNALYLDIVQDEYMSGTVYLIRNNGTLNVTSSTFSAQVAAGDISVGIANYGTTTVTNSTFTVDNVGGKDSGGKNGGIYNASGGTLNVTNSTLAGLTGYGISLDSRSTVTLRNTIVAGNDGGDCINNNGTLSADEFNFDSNGSCGNATQKTFQEIGLGELQRNGGPTPTMRPFAGSVLVNAGNNSLCSSGISAPNYGAGGQDQRGVRRPQNSSCDVGAVERRIKSK